MSGFQGSISFLSLRGGRGCAEDLEVTLINMWLRFVSLLLRAIAVVSVEISLQEQWKIFILRIAPVAVVFLPIADEVMSNSNAKESCRFCFPSNAVKVV